MSRELLVLRHAKSAWDTGAARDFDRPLSKRGRRDAPRVGRFLARSGLTPDYVVGQQDGKLLLKNYENRVYCYPDGNESPESCLH